MNGEKFEYSKLKLIDEILTTINSASSTDEILNYLLDRCIELTNALTGSIMLINYETGVLEIKAARGIVTDKVVKTKLKIGEGVTGRVALTGQSLLIGDVDKVDYYVRIHDDLKSELAVPLKYQDEIIGVISVDSNEKNAFNEDHLDLLKSVASFATQVILKSELIEDLRRKIDRQSSLLKIAELLEESYDLNKIFDKIMKIISEVLNVKRGLLALNEANGNLKLYKGYKISQSALNRGIYKVGEGILGRVYKYGKSRAIADISQSNEFLNKMKIRRGRSERNSFFAIPIKFENKVFGVIGIEKPYENKKEFYETNEFLTIIASLISNKIHNYEKYEKEKESLIRKNIELKDELLKRESQSILIGKDEKIQEIMSIVNMIADTDVSVLILGQTGTGKELIAKMIHYRSKRWDKPFVSVNCAAIPDNLLESELFGYKKGAFTGAIKDKKGKFILANQGTIFLDEICDLSMPLQSKLLRVLQDKIVEPLGAEKGEKVDVRVVAATNKNIEELISTGDFRLDLYYRLNVITIKLPSLVERKDDIPLLIDHFIRVFNRKYDKDIKWVSAKAMNCLLSYSWPGNIRELENVIERAVILARGNVIDVDVLPQNFTNISEENSNFSLDTLVEKEAKNKPEGIVYKSVISQVEKKLIEWALIESNNNKKRAAKLLGIHRNTLLLKIKELGLE